MDTDRTVLVVAVDQAGVGSVVGLSDYRGNETYYFENGWWDGGPGLMGQWMSVHITISSLDVGRPAERSSIAASVVEWCTGSWHGFLEQRGRSYKFLDGTYDLPLLR